MGKFARRLVLLVVAAFAVATLAPAAEATAMIVKMSLADSGADGGCDGCPADDGDLTLCDQACVSSLPALPASLSSAVPAVAEAFEVGTSRSLSGWTWPPDPSPPRLPS